MIKQPDCPINRVLYIPEVFGPLPALSREFRYVRVSPRIFGRNRKRGQGDLASPLALLLWSAGGGLILVGLYGLFASSITRDLTWRYS